MSVAAKFFRERAVIESDQAAEATLENVRERHARSAASWTAMADQAESFERRKLERAQTGGVSHPTETLDGSHR